MENEIGENEIVFQFVDIGSVYFFTSKITHSAHELIYIRISE